MAHLVHLSLTASCMQAEAGNSEALISMNEMSNHPSNMFREVVYKQGHVKCTFQRLKSRPKEDHCFSHNRHSATQFLRSRNPHRGMMTMHVASASNCDSHRNSNVDLHAGTRETVRLFCQLLLAAGTAAGRAEGLS